MPPRNRPPRRNRARILWALALVAGALVAGAAPGSAQVERRAMDASLFRPAADSHGIFVVDRAHLGQPWHWGFRFAMNVAPEPVHLGMSGLEDGAPSAPVTYALGFHLGFHVTFTKWLALAIDVPFSRQWLGAAYDADEPGGFVAHDPASNLGTDPQEVTAGDPRLTLKFRLWGAKGFGLALAAMVTFPFGDEATFNGSAGLTVEPRIIATYTRGRLSFSANLGYLYRERERVYDPASASDEVLLELDDELTWGLGAAVRLTRWLGLGFELYGRGPLLAHRAHRDLPLESLAGLIFSVGRLTWAVGGGLGLGSFLTHHDLQPFGRAPAWRVFTTLAYVPTFSKPKAVVTDTDGDKIPDTMDQCPKAAEDRDGFEDGDGCPDPDNDGDGIEDKKDKCPNEAEDRDGFADGDGCPDPDNDGDGIEDKKDKCPNEAEDFDGHADDDGCPDPDNDGDGIEDKKDKCPNEAEDINGVEDQDGCPEGGGAGGAGTSIRGGKIDLQGKRILFQSGSSVLLKISHPILNRIANMMRASPRVRLVRVEGHTDDKGRARANLRLSQARAATVRDYLIRRGVPPSRLTAVGYGETRPKVGNTSPANRATNRRVEFILVYPIAPRGTP